MLFRGYNGFPDIETFDFECTDTVQVLGGWQGLYKLTKKGTTANILDWIRSHKKYINIVDSQDASTWLKAYNGIFVSRIVYDEQAGQYTLWLNMKDVEYWGINQSGDGVEIKTDEGYSTRSIGGQEFSFYGQKDEFSIALFNYKVTHGFDTPEPPFIYGVHTLKLFHGRGVSTSGDQSFEYGEFKLNDPTPREGYPNGYPAFAPSDMPLSSETQTTWYNSSASPIIGTIAWVDSNINRENDDSAPSGDDGNYGGEESETIPDDGVPSISALSSGFVKLYNPSAAELLSLRNYMYSSSFIDNVKKLLSNPIEYIINLALVASTPETVGTENIGVGGIDTGVSAPTINQYKQIDCGSINIEECYGGFMDYSPMTEVSIYLPFIGTHHLDVSYVMHSTLNLKYAIDFLTGDCIAKLTVQNNHRLDAQVYFYNGNCSCNIPLTSVDYGAKYISMLQGGLGAITSATTGNITGALNSMMEVGLSKPNYNKSGNLGRNAGFLANYTPFILIERPQQSKPSTFKNLVGYKSNIGGVVSDFGGYSEFEYVKLDGIQATDAELDEIKQLLADGVYV